MPSELLLSLGSALDVHGMPKLDKDPRTHCTVEPSSSGRGPEGTVVHRSHVPERDRVVVRGVAVTSPLRTIVDLARCRPLPEVLAAADAGLRLGLFTAGELVRAAAETRGKGSAVLRDVAELADARSGSAFESLVRVALIRARLGPVALQLRFDADSHAYDLALPWARVLVECDSWEHHRSRATFALDRVFGNEAAARRGWALVRVVWAQAWPDPRPCVAAVKAAVIASDGQRAGQRRRRAQLEAS